MDDIKDDDLRERAAHLPVVIRSAWADSSNEKYKRGWLNWTSWCDRHPEAEKIPADPFYIALFLNDMVLDDQKKGHIETAYLGIRWAHRTRGFQSPTDNPFVKTAYEGSKRIAARSTKKNRQEPVDTELLNKLFERYGHTHNALHQRFLVVCFLGFAGFLRISELMAVQMKHMQFKEDHMTIFLEKSKRDQLREGELVYISRLGQRKCPVGITQRYIESTRLDKNPENFLICRLARTKKGHNAIGNQGLSYSRIRENFKETAGIVLEDMGETNVCLHSLRSGGASAAADNGVSDRLIGKHGRWASTTSRDTYIKDSKKSRLTVTKKLGL